LAALCGDVRRLSIGTPQEQLEWMQARLQPHRVESPQGEATGLLTGYYEPILEATRLPTSKFRVPLYQIPSGYTPRKPWFSRQEIETFVEPQLALKGKEIAYLADPIDAMMLHIQGSGRLRVIDSNGSITFIRVTFAGSNEQAYKPIGKWLIDQGLTKDASWPGIKAWIAQNPQRLQELLWTNPRYIFFKEEGLSTFSSGFGPPGAQGVALTPGRSIAVDPGSIPYGAPVWLASNGNQTNLQKLVLAQDTGSAITGAVRADYFAGWGPEAAELAGRLRQPLQMWILWPK
jgi:membrane-bound lytic murein transglycosylase A